MTYQYKLTPGLTALANAALENDGLLYRSQVKQIVSNDQSSFYKLKQLGFQIHKRPIGKTGRNYVVEIIPPAKKPAGAKGLKTISFGKKLEIWFFRQSVFVRGLVLVAGVFSFLMAAKLLSILV